MHFRLKFRKITTSDIGRECRYTPEEGDFETHFHAIIQDIEQVTGTISATSLANHQIDVTSDQSLESFKAALKPILQHHFEYIRMSEITVM